MQVGDDVYVYRRGTLPSWFRWQGLPVTIVRIETNLELACRVPDGNIVSFYPWELTPVWPPRESQGKQRSSDQSTLPDTPERYPIVESPDKDMDKTKGPSEVPRGRHFYDISCRWCKNAVDENHFGLPPRTTHCPRKKGDGTYCHATWSGYNAIHCVMCHRTFSSPSALQRHKRADNECRDSATIRSRQGRPYFGTPVVNEYGTEIWRQNGEGRPDLT